MYSKYFAQILNNIFHMILVLEEKKSFAKLKN